jgi:hypothetical protein
MGIEKLADALAACYSQWTPKVGDILISKIGDLYIGMNRGDKVQIVAELPDSYKIELRTDVSHNYYPDLRVSKIDIRNWFDILQEDGGNATPAVPKRCEHKIVNVSFMSLDMRCKFCDKSEAECKAQEKEIASDPTYW